MSREISGSLRFPKTLHLLVLTDLMKAKIGSLYGSPRRIWPNARGPKWATRGDSGTHPLRGARWSCRRWVQTVRPISVRTSDQLLGDRAHLLLHLPGGRMK